MQTPEELREMERVEMERIRRETLVADLARLTRDVLAGYDAGYTVTMSGRLPADPETGARLRPEGFMAHVEVRPRLRRG